MPKTIKQARIDDAARVITEHYPKRGGPLCWCGEDWTPRHVAKALYAAGLLGVRGDGLRRVDPPGCGCTDCLTGYSVPAKEAQR